MVFKIKFPNLILEEKEEKSYSVLKFGANKTR